jgi:hypothetical protein
LILPEAAGLMVSGVEMGGPFEAGLSLLGVFVRF